jgi:hypothetical protein
MPQLGFRTKLKVLPPNACLGKPIQKTPQPNFYRQPIQESIFSLSNTEFEGGGCDGCGCGDCIFLAK